MVCRSFALSVGHGRLDLESRGEAPPLLERSDQHIEYTEDEPDVHQEVSKDAMEAAGLLSETYNILFNYVQLNSVALLLGVKWRSAIDRLLSIQTLLGRMLDLGVYPLDCSFADREHDTGTPNSIVALLCRAAFPLFTVIIYVLIVQLWAFFQKVERRSKYEVDRIPPVRLVLCVVYFSYCIDIMSDLLRVINCISLRPPPSDHDYAEFELLRHAQSVWAEDTSVICYRGAHLWAVVVAATGLFVCLGIIAFSVYVLRKGKKERKLKQAQFCLEHGFLYLKYRYDGLALYWESIIAVRRVLFATISVYSQTRETTDAEIGLFAIVIVAAITMQEIVKPFDQENSRCIFPKYAGGILRDLGGERLATRWVAFNRYITGNGLEAASLFMSLSLYLTAMSINDGEANSTQEYTLLLGCFFLNALFSVFMFYRIWCGLHCCLDITAKDRQIKFLESRDHESRDHESRDHEPNCDTWMLWKLWVLYVRPKFPCRPEVVPLIAEEV